MSLLTIDYVQKRRLGIRKKVMGKSFLFSGERVIFYVYLHSFDTSLQ